jgi:hypothetical protein
MENFLNVVKEYQKLINRKQRVEEGIFNRLI